MKRSHDKLSSRFAAGCIVAMLAAAAAEPAAAKTSDDDAAFRSPYACAPLDEALQDLSSRGLPLVWSDGLVHSDQQIRPSVARAVVGAPPRRALGVILQPFGLRAEAAAEGDLLLVTADGETGEPSVATLGGTDEGSLPAWTDRDALPVVWSYPPAASEPALPTAVASASAPPYLVVRLRADAFSGRDGNVVDWPGLAFELKERLVELESQRPGLLVALDADPILAGRFVSVGLAPYIDAYTHRGSPFVPEVDATARTWWWVDGEPAALPVLLDAALRGDGLVIFAGQSIDRLHRAFLATIDASGTAEAEAPPVEGLSEDRVRFLIHPTRGDLLLAIYADAGRPAELRFRLPGLDRVEAMLPPHAAFQTQQTQQLDGALRLWLDGGSPYYLLRLAVVRQTRGHRGVEVSDSELVDAYAQVERNQVFQRREREKFESLDVMEYIRNTPQWPSGEQVDWTHRILQRKGKLTEFHHLGYALNGVPYPPEKLLMGRLFRTEAQIQLYPLELELDETYGYRYQGHELVAGRDAYKIEFEPLRDDSRDEGTLVRGTLWIDVRTGAHLRIRIVQKGLEGSLVQRETTSDFGWIADDDECFWDWRRRTGVSVFSSGGESYSYREETVREDFDFNRPDIDQVVQAGHESDVMIHVETPPQGHRWLIKTDEGGRRVRQRADPYPVEGLPAETPGQGGADVELHPSLGGAAGQPEDGFAGADGDEEEQLWSSRVLADIHAFSRHARLDFGGFGSQRGEDVEIYPGIVLTDDDFLGRGIELYVGLFDDRLVGNVGKAGLFGREVVFNALAEITFESAFNPDFEVLDDGTVIGTGLFVQQHEFRFDFAIPLARGLSSRIGYAARSLRIHSNRVDDFVQPLDTGEHALLLGLDLRRGAGLATLGLEAAVREDWRAWGLNAAEPVHDSYAVARAAYGTYKRFTDRNSLGAELVLSKGWDLDRFSRLPFGQAREIVAGFGSERGFDEGAFAGLTWATSLGHKTPITFLVEAGRQRIEAEEWIDRLGLSARFLVHGPWRLDMWPIIGYGIASSVPGEAGDFSYGLVLRRRY